MGSVAGAAFITPEVEGQCSNYKARRECLPFHTKQRRHVMAHNIQGTWGIIQIPPDDPETRFTISVTEKFECTANVPGGLSGSGTVRIEGKKVDITIDWNTGNRGIYTGVFGSDNILRGSTFDASNPGAAVAKWHSDKAFKVV